ncbi:carboxymuconolactone decarboxylase family protein [Chloroflexota bacterium]
MARFSYVEKDEAPQQVADIFAKMEAHGAPVLNLWKTAAHSPSTLAHLVRLGNALLAKTTLDPGLREMAVLRVAAILDCEYEIRAHSMFGKEVGLTYEQMTAIKDWESSGIFDETERAVLRFTDEVAKAAQVSDETFSDLAKHLGPGMMVELALAVGYYGMLARILLPFKVDLDDDAPTSSSQLVGRPQG